MAKRKSVFVVHKNETWGGMHHVHFGSDFNKPKNTKRFRKWDNALKFANKKAVEQGNKTYLVDSPSGPKTVKVKKPKKK